MIPSGSIIVVVGFNRQGLTLSQLFTEAGFDVRVFVMPNEVFHKEYYKTACARRHAPVVYENSNQFADALERIQKEQESRIRVILTSSEVVSDLPSERPDLWDLYDVMASPCEALCSLSNKAFLYNSLKESGFPVSKYMLLSEFKPGESSLSFPVILKRNIERNDIYDYKFKRFDTEEELISFVDKIPMGVRDYLLLQEEIDSKAKDLDFRGYIHNGSIIASAVVDEIRTYPSGVPSYLEEVSDPEILNKVKEPVEAILKAVHYTGFVGIDMKYDSGSGAIYILDVNSRPPISVSSWLYKYTKEQRLKFARTIDEPEPFDSDVYLRWVSPLRDLKALRLSHFKGFDLFKTLTARKDLLYPMRGERKIFFLNIINTLFRSL